MELTPETPIATLVRQVPAAIAVLQKFHIAFCCTGNTPLSAACTHHEIDPARVLADVEQARLRRMPAVAGDAGIPQVIAAIREHYFRPWREELPRITALLAKLVHRHGERLPDVLPPLQHTFEHLRTDLEQHMAKEDQGLFPALIRLGAAFPGSDSARYWIHDPITQLAAAHGARLTAMNRMRVLTDSYTPPADACPTFRGVYYALAELERDLTAHGRLEQDLLFPRALAYVARVETQP